MSSRRRSFLAAILAIGVCVYLAGCVGQTPGAEPQRTLTPLSGVVATGTLVAVEQTNPVSGAVQVVANPTNAALTVKLIGLGGTVGSALEAKLSAARVKSGTACAPYALAYATAFLTSKPNQQFILPSDKSPGWENPSFLHSVILTSSRSTNGCVSSIVAYAPLTWTTGDRRPDIHVIDGGTRAGAEGETSTAAGKPTTYTVVASDNLDSIARRFNLTLNGLFYLNPARTPSPVSTVTKIGEVLNLSKADR